MPSRSSSATRSSIRPRRTRASTRCSRSWSGRRSTDKLAPHRRRQDARAPVAGHRAATSTRCCRYARKAQQQVGFQVLVPLVREEARASTRRGAGAGLHRRRAGRAQARVPVELGATGASRRRAGPTRPSSTGANVGASGSGGRTLRLYYDGPKLHMVAFEENGAVYWVSNTLLDELSQRDDDRDRQGPQAALGGRSDGERSRSAFWARAGSASSPRPASPTSVTRSGFANRRRPSEAPTSRPGRAHLRAGASGAARAQPRRPALHADAAELSRTRRLVVRLRRDAADLFGRRGSLRRLASPRRRFPPRRPPILIMKSTVPVGTGDKVRTRARRARPEPGSATCRTRSSSPRAPRSGTSQHPDRVVIGSFDEEQGDAVARLYEPLGAADRAHRRGVRRDDQVRLERLPGDEDLVHQRDRERLRGDGSRRHRGCARGWASTAGSARVPPRRDRLRGLVLSQGHRRAQAACGQLGLPLPAPHRR